MKKFNLLLVLILILRVLPISAINNSILRVGTTGDYPPLTYYDSSTDQYSGFDIDMAKSLAKYLKMKLIFVKTS